MHNIVLARVAATASIEHFGKVNISTPFEDYCKNATPANFQTVVRNILQILCSNSNFKFKFVIVSNDSINK